MLKYLTICLVMLLSIIGSVNARSTHDLRTTGDEQLAWWGDSAQAYVKSNCTHATSGTTTVTITNCAAYIKDIGPPDLLRYAQEDSRTFSYAQGNGKYWLGVTPTTQEAVSGWERVVNTHYVYKLSEEYPGQPDRVLITTSVTVSGGAVTVVDGTLAPGHPFIFDGAAYLTNYGGVCDGVTDNSVAMAAARDALPPTGGRIILPASRFACAYGTSFTITTKPITVSGAGGTGANREDFIAETTLEYTGSGCAIEIDGIKTRGSVLEHFELDHTGTADHGICIGIGNSSLIQYISINKPKVPFVLSGIRLTDNATVGHSNTVQNSSIEESAPIGIDIRRSIGTYIINNAIHGHSACNIAVGSENIAKDTHILHNRLEAGAPNQGEDLIDSWAICARNAEGLWIMNNHFEVGQGANGILRTLSTENQCEHCVIAYNHIALPPSPIPGDGVFFFDAPGSNPAAYVFIHHNRIFDGRPPGPATCVVDLANTSGNGGASIISINDNEISESLCLTDSPEFVSDLYEHKNNYFLGTLRDGQNRNMCIDYTIVGNVDTGEDELMPPCTVYYNRLREDGVGLYIYAAGDVTAANEDKRVRLYFDSQLIYDTGTINLAVDAQSGWFIECRGVRSSSTGIRFLCHGNALDSPGTMLSQYTPLTIAGGFLVSYDLQVTGQATTTGAIQQFYQYVELVQQ